MLASSPTSGAPAAACLLVSRLLLAFIFVHEGLSKIGSYDGAVAYMHKFGVPARLLPAVIALQLAGGLLIAAGIMARLSALAFAVFCVLTAILFHWQLADRNEVLHLQKDLAIAGGIPCARVLRAGRLVAWPLLPAF